MPVIFKMRCQIHKLLKGVKCNKRSVGGDYCVTHQATWDALPYWKKVEHLLEGMGNPNNDGPDDFGDKKIIRDKISFERLLLNHTRGEYEMKEIYQPEIDPDEMVDEIMDGISDKFHQLFHQLKAGEVPIYLEAGTDLSGKIIYYWEEPDYVMLFFPQVPAVVGKPMAAEYWKSDGEAMEDESNNVDNMIGRYLKLVEQLKSIRDRVEKLNTEETVISTDNVLDIFEAILTHLEYMPRGIEARKTRKEYLRVSKGTEHDSLW